MTKTCREIELALKPLFFQSMIIRVIDLHESFVAKSNVEYAIFHFRKVQIIFMAVKLHQLKTEDELKTSRRILYRKADCRRDVDGVYSK